MRPLVSLGAVVLWALTANAPFAKPRAPMSAASKQPLSPQTRAARALADFEQQHAGEDTARDPALALDRAELVLAVLEASGAQDLSSGAARAAHEASLSDAKLRLGQAKQPKGGAKPGDKARIGQLEARYEHARQRAIVLLGDDDLATFMGAGRLEPDVRAFDPSLSTTMDQRAAALKKQLASVKAADLTADAGRVQMNVAEAVRAGNTELGQLAHERIVQRKLGSPDQSLANACKRLSKPVLVWRLRLAESVVKGTIARAYTPAQAIGDDSHSYDAKAVNEVLGAHVLEAGADVEALKGCASSGSLPGLPLDLSELAEPSLAAQLAARAAAREAATALTRVTGLSATRDALKKKLAPQLERTNQSASNGKAAEKKFLAAVAQTKKGLVVLDPLVAMETQAAQAEAGGKLLLPEVAKLRAAEQSMGQELTQGEERSNALKLMLANAKAQTAKLKAAVGKLGQPNGKDRERDAAIAAAQANVARADDSLKDATNAAAAMQRDLSKLQKLAALGSAKDLPARNAKTQATDAAFVALVAQAKQRVQDARTLRQREAAKGSPAGCNIAAIDWGAVKYAEQPEFGDGDMGGVGLEQVDYGDTDGNGSYEAFLFWHGSMSGTAGGDFSQLVVFELDAKCKPHEIGFADGALFASGTLKGKTYRIDASVLEPGEMTCCPSGHTASEYRVADGKLKQLR